MRPAQQVDKPSEVAKSFAKWAPRKVQAAVLDLKKSQSMVISTDIKVVTAKVQNVLSLIRASSSPKPLLRLYENAIKYPSISEFERELIVEEIELKLREISPSQATKVFGPKDATAREFLETVFASISREFNLQENEVRNGVKVGGDMISGRKHIDMYISYKNAAKWNVGLAWMQDSVASDSYLRFRRYQNGLSNSESFSEKNFSVSESDMAVKYYSVALKEII